MHAARPALAIRLLGHPQLLEEGTPLGFRAPARALSLLVYLLLHRDEPSARDTVAFIFWPDLPEPEARAKLRYDMRELREALPPAAVPWILADNRTLRWNPDAAIQIDVAEFERLAADPAGAAKAVDLYGGDLASRLDDEWLEAPRERLRELQSRLLQGLIDSSRAQGDAHRAIAYAQRLVAHDPWREDAVRALIELRHETGDRAGALQFYREFAERLHAELGVEPMAETTAVYEGVVATVDARGSAHNLPVALTTFVGREREVAALHALLRERRLVTLIGAGGVGKTRLAIEAARTLVGHFSEGVWLVELAPLSDPALIVSTIATSLGMQNPSERSLLAMLQGKRLLLVLDNCEHLIVDAARIVERLTLECPQMHVLVTSREPLRSVGERTERVVSLELPAADDGAVPSLERLQESPAVRLFLDRAADVSPAFRIHGGSEIDRAALATISRRLDGIPLAIEFAAARMSSLSIEVLARGLDDRFTLLTAGKRTALPRQQTLRATLDWSYDLLTTSEQRLLHRLGIFAGGWTLEAVSAVCSDDAAAEARIVDLLASLVDKSLVVIDVRAPHPRYHLLETTRAYALERLAQNGEAGRIARRHAEYFLAFAQHNDNTWGAAGSYVGLERFYLELDNYRAALSWALGTEDDPGLGATLIGSLRWAFAARSLNAESVRWCDLAFAALGPHPQPIHEAKLQLALAGSMGTLPFFPRFHYYRAGQPGRFLAAAERASELLLSVGDAADRALALSLVVMHLRLMDQPRALPIAEEALAVARAGGNRLAIGMALYAMSFAIDRHATADRLALLTEALESSQLVSNTYHPSAILHALGEVAFEAGDVERALQYAQQSASVESGLAPVNRAQAHISCAAYSLVLGMIDEARESARYALTVARRIGEQMTAGAAFQHAAGIAAVCGDVERAARLLGASDARRADAPARLYTEQTGYDRTRTIVRERLSDENVERLIREGYLWSIDYAIEQATAV